MNNQINCETGKPQKNGGNGKKKMFGRLFSMYYHTTLNSTIL